MYSHSIGGEDALYKLTFYITLNYTVLGHAPDVAHPFNDMRTIF